jgi:hypothetical protein
MNTLSANLMPIIDTFNKNARYLHSEYQRSRASWVNSDFCG